MPCPLSASASFPPSPCIASISWFVSALSPLLRRSLCPLRMPERPCRSQLLRSPWSAGNSAYPLAHSPSPCLREVTSFSYLRRLLRQETRGTRRKETTSTRYPRGQRPSWVKNVRHRWILLPWLPDADQLTLCRRALGCHSRRRIVGDAAAHLSVEGPVQGHQGCVGGGVA